MNDLQYGTYYKSGVKKAYFHSIKLDIDEIGRIHKILDQVTFLSNFLFKKKFKEK